MKPSHLHQIIEQICKNYFDSKTRFILAVSGGVDSMVMMEIMTDLFQTQCTVITIDHHIRTTSHLDTSLVIARSQKKGIPCFIEHIDIPSISPQGKSIEELARMERYRILERARLDYQAQAIVTAHHAQDQMETQIMHIIRGCDIAGLVGMETWNTQHIFRPFLGITKTKLQTFAIRHNIKWHEDETNKDTRYLRNHVRSTWNDMIRKQLLQEIGEQAKKLGHEINRITSDWERTHTPLQQPFNRKVWHELPLYARLIWLHHILGTHFQIENISAAWLGHMYHWLETAKNGSIFLYKNQALFRYQTDRISILDKFMKE